MFEHDLFISYTHIDNEPFDGSEGWITLLHKRLEIRLAQLLGEPARIWRDPKLQGNDYFGDTLLDKLAQVTSIVSVLSPRYIKSEWCQKELREFYRQAAANGGVRVDDKSRIFKVSKMPIPREKHPPELQPLLGYEFFAIDQATNRVREFNHETGPDRDKRYWDTLEDLAQDIKNLIERLRGPEQPAANASGKTIYLAETTSDLAADRDRIRRELELNGHRVVPDKPLPLDQRLRQEVNDYLATSHLAVHLVGALYGVVPEGESKSIVELQHELAAARVGAAEFSQIIWMPPDLNSSDERQQRFIGALSDHLNLPKGAVLLRLKLEDLKTFIGEKLKPPPAPPEPQKPAPANDHHNPALVYLVYDQPDCEAVQPIEDYFFERGFEYFSMAADTDPGMHRQYLQECDAVLTYCGNSTEGWLQMKRIDLLKLASVPRAKPLLAKGFYLSGPETQGKDRFRVQDGLVIRNFGAFSAASLAPFIEKIESAKGARP